MRKLQQISAFAFWLGASCNVSAAQDSGSEAAVMWGTGTTAPQSAMQSAIMHERNGVVAAQVNAAELGLLLGQSAINMTAVGSQTVVNVEIAGSDNDVDINADQTATNSGDQQVDGTIVVTGTPTP